MCPACLSSAAWAIAGITSAGGLTRFVVSKRRPGTGTKNTNPPTVLKGADDESSRNRIEK